MFMDIPGQWSGAAVRQRQAQLRESATDQERKNAVKYNQGWDNGDGWLVAAAVILCVIFVFMVL